MNETPGPESETIRPVLETIVAKWKPMLRVSDWEVTIGYAHQHEFRSPSAEAQCHYERNLKRARILVLEPAEYHSGNGFPQDIEETVVHELLHLHFATIDDSDGVKEVVFEQAIESIATSIIALERRQ